MSEDETKLPGSPPKPPVPEPVGFEPQPTVPQMEAPELESLSLKGDALAEASGPIASYVSHEPIPEAGDTPFLRDTPFGDAPGFGGETPFFMGSDSGGSFDFETDDTDGIPTGLPDLHDLPPPPEDAPDGIPREPESTPDSDSSTVPGVPRVVYVSAKPLNPKKQRIDRASWFMGGVLLASALWGILLWLSLQSQ